MKTFLLNRQQVGWPGLVIFVLAFLLRLLPVFVFPSIHYPDEIFQSLEPAHRLVFGQGLLSWEWLYGARSWLFPGFIAALMESSRLVGEGPQVYLPFIGVFLAALSAASAFCAFLWGRRFYGLWGGILAGCLMAVWVDAVYLGPRTLLDGVAGHLLIIGLYLLVASDKKERAYCLWLAGFMLGLIALLRLHLAPAIALLLCWPWQNLAPWRQRVLPLSVGLCAALLLYGVTDALTWDYPFESLWHNLHYNLGLGVSRYFGKQPWFYYIDMLQSAWTLGVLGILLLLACWGFRFLPQALSMAAVIFLTLSLLEHKEWRFLYPAILLLLVSAGLGLARLGAELAQTRRGANPLVLVMTLALSFALPLVSPLYASWWTKQNELVSASKLVSQLKGVCGIVLYGIPASDTGGYTLLHQNAPLYWFNQESLLAHQDAFNVVISATPAPLSSAYHTLACFAKVCVSQRTGSCTTLPMAALRIPPALESLPPVKYKFFNRG